jgi:hypothetical protein
MYIYNQKNGKPKSQNLFGRKYTNGPKQDSRQNQLRLQRHDKIISKFSAKYNIVILIN